MSLLRRKGLVVILALVLTFLLWRDWAAQPSPLGITKPITKTTITSSTTTLRPADGDLPEPDQNFLWRHIEHNYPVNITHDLPTSPETDLPPVQAKFGWQSSFETTTCLERQEIIRAAFSKAWLTYREHAWLHDEVGPVSGSPKDTYGGWAATLIDSLDTLWIMGLADEFELAVDAVHEHISFETTSARTINVFETTIRLLGGLISAYDLSGDPRLLSKARDAGDLLYKAFDTPTRLPVTTWDLHYAAKGRQQQASSAAVLAELASMSLEFTRLSLLTGDPRYFDAVQRVGELLADTQMKTKVPGLWASMADAAHPKLDINGEYSLGAMSDSANEYLPKMVALLGQPDIYADMYTKSVEAMEERLLFCPMTPDGHDILFSGTAHVKIRDQDPESYLEASTSHLACFAGGMLALGGRLVSDERHVGLGERLAGGCVWAYGNTTSGVMPEALQLQACPSTSTSDTQVSLLDKPPCAWDRARWHEGIIKQTSSTDVENIIEEEALQPGVTKISDARYLLRPEAIESVFILYRVTGDPAWRERAWDMWLAIDALTSTELANSAVWDVNVDIDGGEEKPSMMDSMESFWMAETLKYFYLVFAEPDVVSLDEWVFNTEAHPFRRLRRARG
jgi:mannosyl-oligosaccharide alpha-1,2-mannosidase